MSDDLLELAAELQRKQEPFALATVVRCEAPTSAKPGSKALIRADATVNEEQDIVGFRTLQTSEDAPDEGSAERAQWLAETDVRITSALLTLGRDVPVQMIRVGLPQGTDLYPEISGSHYRCSVRFLIWQDAGTRPVQTNEDVPFTLSTCT